MTPPPPAGLDSRPRSGPIDGPPPGPLGRPPCGSHPDRTLGEEVCDRIAGGEGRRLELKRGLPGPGKIARTLAAFANGVGGLFVIGAEDNLTLVGVRDPGTTLAELEDVVQNDLRPPPTVRVWTQAVQDGQGTEVSLVLCWVRRSESLPHGARQSDGQWEVCERLAASTRRCEVRAIEEERARIALLNDDERRVLDWIERATAADRPSRTTMLRAARATGLARSRLRRALHRLESGGWIFGWGADDLRRRCC